MWLAALGIIGVGLGLLGAWLAPSLLAFQERPGTDSKPVTSPPSASRSMPQPTAITAVIPAVALGGVFALIGWRYGIHGLQWKGLLACLYAALLYEIAIIDFHTRLVLNILSYPSGAIGLVGSVAWAGIGPTSALLGGAVALLLFAVIEIVGRGAMGRGDTKLAAVIGLMRGFPTIWQAVIAGILTGGVFAIGLLAAGRGRRTTFAYGPALAIGAVISMLITPK